MRGLILRKTRKSCTDTVLVTWEEDVVPRGHPILKGAKRDQRHSYLFPNRSEIVVGGCDDITKIMSSQWDFIGYNEAIEGRSDEWEALTTRMRNGAMPYSQMIADTNPDAPTHWLWKRQQDGLMKRVQSTIQDNPRFWNEQKNCLTPSGEKYIEKLKRLTGARYDRFYLGKWSTPEGARWPQMDPNVHLFDAHILWPHGVPGHYTKFLGIDHGIANPYCCLWNCVDFDGNVYTYKEDYQIGYTADLQAQRIIELSPSNDKYYAEYLDPSMWNQDARARGKAPSEISAADLYYDEFRDDARFGPLLPGYNRNQAIGYSTLDSLLNRDNGHPDWFIERGCTNLYAELVGAVFGKSERTGVWNEDLDPKCPNHAIKAGVYGLHTHLQLPPETKPSLLDPQELRILKQKERDETSERSFKKSFKKIWGRKSIRF